MHDSPRPSFLLLLGHLFFCQKRAHPLILLRACPLLHRWPTPPKSVSLQIPAHFSLTSSLDIVQGSTAELILGKYFLNVIRFTSAWSPPLLCKITYLSEIMLL